MKILIVGRHPALLARALAQVSQLELSALGVTRDDEAEAHLRAGGFALVVLGGGVEQASRERLRQLCAALQPAPQILEIFGPDMLLPKLRQWMDETSEH